jgi:hypothetical protein
VRSLFRLALGLLALLVGVRLWAMIGSGRRRGAYYLSGARQVRMLFWPLAGLVASLPFVLGVARRATVLPSWALVLVVVLGAALLSLSVPALVLHWRYRRHDAETVVLFDPATDHFEIRRPDRAFLVVRPAAVRAATHTRPRATAAFWARYETLALDFTDGTPPVVLTSAVLDLGPVAAWLRAQRVPVGERRSGLAWA